MLDFGLLVLRVGIGFLLMGHGAQKLFGWFGGPRLSGTTQFFANLGLRPARLWATFAALGELGGGLLTALGFLGPIGPAVILAVMLVASTLVHWTHGFWNAAGGVEFPLTIGLASIALALTGFGRFALDRVTNVDLHEPAIVAAAMGAAVLGALVSIATTHARSRPAHALTGA